MHKKNATNSFIVGVMKPGPKSTVEEHSPCNILFKKIVVRSPPKKLLFRPHRGRKEDNKTVSRT